MTAKSAQQTFVCCFCGQAILSNGIVQLRATTQEMGDEVQLLYAHKTHFRESLHSSIPLHPNFVE